MTKEEIFKILRAATSESSDIVEKVTADVYYSGEAELVLADDGVVNRLFDRWKNKKSTDAAAAKVAADNPDFCPVCKLATTPIFLDRDRPAKWCARHFVVFPTKEKAK